MQKQSSRTAPDYDSMELAVPEPDTYKAQLPFSKEEFQRRLRVFLDDQQMATKIDNELIEDLYYLVQESATQFVVADMLRTGDARKDWTTRGALIRRVSAQVEQTIELLEKQKTKLASQQQTSKLSLTETLTDSLLNTFQRIAERLERTEVQHRAGESMAKQLRKKNSTCLHEVSIGIKDFLKRHASGLTTRERDLIIAGCLSAGSFYPKKEKAKDLVARIPMQLSRAEKAYRGEESRVVFNRGRKTKT